MFSWNITVLRNLGSFLPDTYAHYKIGILPFVPPRKVKTIVLLSLLSLYPKFPSLLGIFGANYYTVPVASFVFPINLWTLISTMSFVSQFSRPVSGVFWSDLMGLCEWLLSLFAFSLFTDKRRESWKLNSQYLLDPHWKYTFVSSIELVLSSVDVEL